MNRCSLAWLSSGRFACRSRGGRLLLRFPPASRAALPPIAQPGRADDAPYQAEVDEGLGAAVAILDRHLRLDARAAPGDTRPKHVVARQALRGDARRDGRVRRQAPGFSDQDRHLLVLEQRLQGAAHPALQPRRRPRRVEAAAGPRRRHGHRRGDARRAAAILSRRRLPEVPAGGHRRREHERTRPRRRWRGPSSARARARCRSTSSRSTRARRSLRF